MFREVLSKTPTLTRQKKSNQTLVHQYLSPASVIVTSLNGPGPGIRPVQLLPLLVDGQAIGPRDVPVDDHCPLRSVHAGSFDFRIITPVRPVHKSREEGGDERENGSNDTDTNQYRRDKDSLLKKINGTSGEFIDCRRLPLFGGSVCVLELGGWSEDRGVSAYLWYIILLGDNIDG